MLYTVETYSIKREGQFYDESARDKRKFKTEDEARDFFEICKADLPRIYNTEKGTRCFPMGNQESYAVELIVWKLDEDGEPTEGEVLDFAKYGKPEWEADHIEDCETIEERSIKVYEDNAGTLALFVFQGNEQIYSHDYYGAEAQLGKDVALLEKGIDPRNWDGDDDLNVDDWNFVATEAPEIIYWDGIKYLSNMGIAGKLAFGITGE